VTRIAAYKTMMATTTMVTMGWAGPVHDHNCLSNDWHVNTLAALKKTGSNRMFLDNAMAPRNVCS
jgi:hypothetical protein